MAESFDEMRSGANGLRLPYRGVAQWLDSTSPEKLAATRHEVDQFYRRHGITFGAYGAALALYNRWIKRGSDVSFARDTRIVVQTTARRAQVLQPNAPAARH